MDVGAVATIITTIIVEAAGIIGLLIKQNGERKQNAIDQARRDQKIDDRLARIEENQNRQEKKIDEHNGYAKRFGEIEKAIVKIETKMSAN